MRAVFVRCLALGALVLFARPVPAQSIAPVLRKPDVPAGVWAITVAAGLGGALIGWYVHKATH